MIRGALAGLVLAALLAVPAGAYEFTRVTFDNAPFGAQPTTKIFGVLHTPDGKGPFPAVVVLQACGGWDDNVATDWPRYLTGLGYATLGIDILSSRKVKSACEGNPIPLDERMRDIYGGIVYLAQRKEIDPARIHAIGFSWGGQHVLEAMLERRPAQFARGANAVLKSGIAVYPSCTGMHQHIAAKRGRPTFYAPVLIIAAELDDWTPVSECRTVIEGQLQGRARMEILAGAHHGFDQFTQGSNVLAKRKVLGHTMEPNRAATNTARALVKAFLEKPE